MDKRRVLDGFRGKPNHYLSPDGGSILKNVVKLGDPFVSAESKIMVVVIATILTESGKRDEVLKHFGEVVPKVLQEEGCIEYVPIVDIQTMIPTQVEPNQDQVVMLEKWESTEALEQHLLAPHMLEFRTQVKDMIKTVSLQVLSPDPS